MRVQRDIPNTVTILGAKHTVEWEEIAEHGLYIGDQRRIMLRNGLDLEEAQHTLLHEVIHGGLFRSGHTFRMDEGDEEALVRCISHTLWDAGYRLTRK